ncbi:MAG: PAS domain S-box protein, partial [Planctomycetaceae bacterium]|nr:PAS domain S-box protein [Planctomycetaceae bacterium]
MEKSNSSTSSPSDRQTTPQKSAVLNALQVEPFIDHVDRLLSHPILVTEADGGIAWANQAFCHLTGWSLSEIRGRHPAEFLHGPRTDPAVVTRILQESSRGVSFSAEIVNYRRDGSPFPAGIDVTPIFDETGVLVGHTSLQTDLSQRRMAEDQLAMEHRMLQSICGALTGFIQGKQSDRPTLTRLLDDLLELGGASRGLILESTAAGESFAVLTSRGQFHFSAAGAEETHSAGKPVVPDSHHSCPQILPNAGLEVSRALNSTTPFVIHDCPDWWPVNSPAGGPSEVLLVLPLAAQLPVECAVVVGLSTADKATALVEKLSPLVTTMGHLLDAGRRERRRLEAEQSLREVETFLSESGKLAGVGGWQLDLRTNQLYWTSQTRAIHGVDDDYQPLLETATDFYAPEGRHLILNAVREGMATGQPWDLELPFINFRGERLWVRAQGKAVFEDGQPVRLFGAFQDITERHKADEALREAQNALIRSEQYFRTLIERSSDGKVVFDRRGKLLYASPAVKRLTGYSGDELQEMWALDFLPRYETQRPELVEPFVENTGQSADILCRVQQRDGRIIWIEGAARNLLDDEAIQGIVLNFRDVTDRVRSTQSEKAQRIVLELIAAKQDVQRTMQRICELTEEHVDDSRTCIVLLDERRRIRSVTAPSLPVEFCSALTGLEIRDGFATCGTAMARGLTYVTEDTETDPCWCNMGALAAQFDLRACWATPILTAEGDVAGCCSVYHRHPATPGPEDLRLLEDLSRLAGLVLIRAQEDQKLQRSESHLREAQQRAKLGYWMLDLATDQMEWSDELYQILGLPRGKKPTLSEVLTHVIHPDDARQVRARQQEAVAHPGRVVSVDARVIRGDGTIRWLAMEGSARSDEKGIPVHMRGTAQDITDRKRADEERAALQAQLWQAQKIDSIGRLAGGVAHDFNNMLA